MYGRDASTPVWRSLRRVQAPYAEPVLLTEAKAALGLPVDVSEDDDLINSLIASARELVELRIGQTLMLCKWQARVNRTCCCGMLEVPMPPLYFDSDKAPVEVRWRAANGMTKGLEQKDIDVDPEEFPGRIRLPSWFVNTGDCCDSRVTVTWWAGYDDHLQVPKPIRTAIMRIVVGLYTQRGEEAANILGSDPAIDSMLAICGHTGRY